MATKAAGEGTKPGRFFWVPFMLAASLPRTIRTSASANASAQEKMNDEMVFDYTMYVTYSLSQINCGMTGTPGPSQHSHKAHTLTASLVGDPSRFATQNDRR